MPLVVFATALLITTMHEREFFSVKPYLCAESGSCATRTGNDVYYLDGTHFSPRAYDLFKDDLKLALVRLSDPIR